MGWGGQVGKVGFKVGVGKGGWAKGWVGERVQVRIEAGKGWVGEEGGWRNHAWRKALGKWKR